MYSYDAVLSLLSLAWLCRFIMSLTKGQSGKPIEITIIVPEIGRLKYMPTDPQQSPKPLARVDSQVYAANI